MIVTAFLKARSAALIAALLVGVTVCLYLSGVLREWGIPEAGQVAFVILVTAAILWITEAVPLFVTSLIILFLSLVWLGPMLEDAGADGISKATWTAPFFSDVVLLFLGGFVLAAGLHK